MTDFSTTVSVIDNFSNPLQTYQEELSSSLNLTNVFTDSLAETVGQMREMSDSMMESIMVIPNEVIPSLMDTRDAAYEVADSFRAMTEDLSVSSIARFVSSLAGLVVQLGATAKGFFDAGVSIGKFIFHMQNSTTYFILNLSTNITKKMIGSYKAAFSHMNEMISKNLDAINLQDKMGAMWGDAGEVASEKMYYLANELGENAGEVAKAAASAAAQGIGTKDFEDIYRFADKIAGLNPGEDTNSVAQTLVSNIKSGHDAETMSGLFGGGEKMSRQLKQMGYERKLNQGDLQGALDIAKKVAEQAGYTEEKYQKAGDSMSENFKYIHSVMGNIKQRMEMIYTKHFQPIVKKIADLMKSQAFQNFIAGIEFVVDKAGAAIGGMIEFLVDHWQILAAAVGAMLLSKGLLIGRIIGILWKFKGIILGVGKIAFGLILKLRSLVMAMIGLNSAGAGGLKAMIKANLKWVLIAGAVFLVLKLIQKLTGDTYSLLGIVAGGYKFLQNCFTNVIIFFAEKLPNRIQTLWLKIKKGLLGFIGYAKQNFGQFITWVVSSIMEAIRNSPLGQILDFIGIDIEGATKEFEGWVRDSTKDWGKDDFIAAHKIDQQIADINNNEMQFLDTMEGVEEAMRNPSSTITWLKDIFTVNKKTGEGIETANDQLKKMNEQEEELRWMKAFSDRQITSHYNSMTSYTRNVNINGMSQAGIVEMGRRSLSAMPSRAAM